MRLRGGFTMVELVVVLMLTGVVLTIAAPRIELGELRTRAADRAVTTALMRAQQLAILRQHDVRVLFDTAASRVVIHADLDGDGEREAGEVEEPVYLEEGVRFENRGVPAGPAGVSAVSFQADAEGLPALTFHRNGSASERGGFYLGTSRSAAGLEPQDARALVIDRATGRVRRFHVEGTQWKRSQ